MKKIIILILLICLTIISIIIFGIMKNNSDSLASENYRIAVNNESEQQKRGTQNFINEDYSTEENKNINKENDEEQIIGEQVDQIEIVDIDGKGKNYQFEYNNEIFKVSYTKDNWHINDSYKIKNKKVITQICEKLIKIHPIHGKDMKSYRKVEDLVYEWEQHNTAYDILPEDSSWKKNAKSVDLDPKDQGKSLIEMYNIRTKKK